MDGQSLSSSSQPDSDKPLGTMVNLVEPLPLIVDRMDGRAVVVGDGFSVNPHTMSRGACQRGALRVSHSRSLAAQGQAPITED